MPGEELGPSQKLMRIVVISSIRLYRDGLAWVLLQLDDVVAVAAYPDGAQGFLDEQPFRDRPEGESLIVLLDMSALNSIATARLISRELPMARLVALAVPETEPDVLACAEVGAVGYVAREGSLDDLVSVVRLAARGEARCSPAIVAGLLRRVAALSMDRVSDSAARHLTNREFEIAEHIAVGMSNRAIAARLSIELCTVKNHVHNILAKLGARDRNDVANCLRV